MQALGLPLCLGVRWEWELSLATTVFLPAPHRAAVALHFEMLVWEQTAGCVRRCQALAVLLSEMYVQTVLGGALHKRMAS